MVRKDITSSHVGMFAAVLNSQFRAEHHCWGGGTIVQVSLVTRLLLEVTSQGNIDKTNQVDVPETGRDDVNDIFANVTNVL